MSDTIYRQKDIVLVPFPYSDLTGAKRRPALIISNSKLNGEDFVCCLITSKKQKEFEIKKSFMVGGSLPFKSWAKPHRIFTIDKRVVVKKLGSIKNNFYKDIVNKISSYFELE